MNVTKNGKVSNYGTRKYNTAKYIVLLVYLYRTHIKYKGLPVTGFFGSK